LNNRNRGNALYKRHDLLTRIPHHQEGELTNEGIQRSI
jgi:hypothetical protein